MVGSLILLLFFLNVIVRSEEIISSLDLNETTLWDRCKPQFQSHSRVNTECLANLDCLSLGHVELIEKCYSMKLEYLKLDTSEMESDLENQNEHQFLFEREIAYDYAATLNVSNQGQLNEWTPVSASISLDEIQRFEFPINYTSPGLSSGYDIIIFFSASICTMPTDWDDSRTDNGLSIYYTLNETLFINSDYDSMDSTGFEYGFAQAFSKVQVSDTNQTLYIAVKPDDCSDCSPISSWTYDLGVSQNSLVFQYDMDQMISPIDTDYDSVLLSTLSSSYDNSSSFILYVFSDSQTSNYNYLNNSWCAIQNSQDYIARQELTSENITTSTFQLTGFNESTTYKAVLLQEFTSVAYGGVIYKAFDFTTKSSTSCKIISNLDFCTNVAYAVPNSDTLDATSLALSFDNYAKQLYENFDYALQQVACDTEVDARYSPIRTCDDCAESYKNWLCAVTIPRCTTLNETGYKHYDALDGRNSFIRETIRPNLDYYEILPCVNMCYAIVRDCPSDFNFACPTKNVSIQLSYYWDEGLDYTSCNYIGDSDITNAAIRLIGVNGINWIIWVVFGVLYSLL